MSDIFRDTTFGGFFREFRVRHGFTLRSAAERMKSNAGNLSKMERSILNPPASAIEVRALCKRLKFSEDETAFLITMAFSFHSATLKERFWGAK